MNNKKFNPDDYTKEELQRLANIGLKADIERALARLPEGYLDEYTDEKARWLEKYLMLNPGGICSLDKVKITRHKEDL